MFESLFSSVSADTSITFPALLAALGTAFALGIAISLVYMKTHKTKTPSHSFALGSNIARAFSLAGAFSIIRFRSAPGDAKDITYVLFTMAVGLAAGMGFLLYAAVITAALCMMMLVLEIAGYGRSKGTVKMLKITVPENLDFKNAFDEVIQKYVISSKLQRIKTADLGSLYELVYSVTMNDSINEKDFIDELRCRNGNLNITLILDAPLGEF